MGAGDGRVGWRREERVGGKGSVVRERRGFLRGWKMGAVRDVGA